MSMTSAIILTEWYKIATKTFSNFLLVPGKNKVTSLFEGHQALAEGER